MNGVLENISHLLRNPNNDDFARVMLVNSPIVDEEYIEAITALRNASHSHFLGSELESKYVEKAHQGISYLLEQFSNQSFRFSFFERFVDLTAYSQDSATRRVNGNEDEYFISGDVITVIEAIRKNLGFPCRFNSDDLASNSYEINLTGISYPVSVNSISSDLVQVNLVPVEFEHDFIARIEQHTNWALNTSDSEAIVNAIILMQTVMHKWHTVGGVASRAVNFFNSLLIHHNYKPVPHGVFDYASLLMTEEELVTYVLRAVQNFNPSQDIIG